MFFIRAIHRRATNQPNVFWSLLLDTSHVMVVLLIIPQTMVLLILCIRTKFSFLRTVRLDTLLPQEVHTGLYIEENRARSSTRAFSSMTDNLSVVKPLTPGHFLIGRVILSPPESDFSNECLSYVNR